MSSSLHLCIAICTRNRGENVRETVGSALRAGQHSRQVLVVDQSCDEASAGALAPWVRSGEIVYLRSAEGGLARARNLAVTRSTADIIAFTDDDCDVPEDWLRRIAEAFETDPRIGIVFGNVLPAPHDTGKGFIPFIERQQAVLVGSIRHRHRLGGMGACMAIRRVVWDALSGFDPFLGAGSPLRSAEENDFVLRALHCGFWVLETPSLHIVHRGFRTWAETDTLVFDYLYGTGAMFAKHLRMGHGEILELLVRVGWSWMFSTPLIRYSRSPRRLLRLRAFCSGWVQGLRTPLSRSRQQFATGRKPLQGEANDDLSGHGRGHDHNRLDR